MSREKQWRGPATHPLSTGNATQIANTNATAQKGIKQEPQAAK
jgi:hypothetical protein